MKPLACKIWPFKICNNARYGNPNGAYFQYKNEKTYIYIYPNCPGTSYGKPSEQLTQITIPEFIEIRLGLREWQLFSTSKLRHTLY